MSDEPDEPTLYQDHSLQESGWRKPTKQPRADARPAGLPPKLTPPTPPAKDEK